MDLAINVQPANDPPYQIREQQTAKEQRQDGNQIELGIAAVKTHRGRKRRDGPGFCCEGVKIVIEPARS